MRAARRKAGHREPLGMTCDDVQSLRADGSGGTEDDDGGLSIHCACFFDASSLPYNEGKDRSGMSTLTLSAICGNSEGNMS